MSGQSTTPDGYTRMVGDRSGRYWTCEQCGHHILNLALAGHRNWHLITDALSSPEPPAHVAGGHLPPGSKPTLHDEYVLRAEDLPTGWSA